MAGGSYIREPFQCFFWYMILFGIFLEIFDELGKDGFEVFELVGRRHRRQYRRPILGILLRLVRGG